MHLSRMSVDCCKDYKRSKFNSIVIEWPFLTESFNTNEGFVSVNDRRPKKEFWMFYPVDVDWPRQKDANLKNSMTGQWIRGIDVSSLTCLIWSNFCLFRRRLFVFSCVQLYIAVVMMMMASREAPKGRLVMLHLTVVQVAWGSWGTWPTNRVAKERTVSSPQSTCVRYQIVDRISNTLCLFLFCIVFQSLLLRPRIRPLVTQVGPRHPGKTTRQVATTFFHYF